MERRTRGKARNRDLGGPAGTASAGLSAAVLGVAACLALAPQPAAARQAAASAERAAVVEALHSGAPDRARQLAESALAREPRDPALWTLKGLALAGLSQEEEALAAYLAALDVAPDYLPALQGAAEIEYRTGRPEAAGRLERLVARDPANAVAHGMLGALAFDRRDCGAAAAHFEQSGDAIDANADALEQFGHCLYMLGRLDAAVGAFRRLREAAPGDPAAAMKLAVALHAGGRSDEALELLGPLAERPDAGGALLSLVADIHAGRNELADAVDALQRAIAGAPRDEAPYLNLASLCLEREAFDLALEVATVGLQNVPESARLYTIRGVVHAQLRNHDLAEADFARAGRLEPERPVGRVGQSLALQQAGRVDESIELLRAEAERHPEDAATLFLLAKALAATGAAEGSPEAREAEEALLGAVALAPDFVEAHAELGKLLVRRGELDRAIDHLRRVIDLDPSNRPATYQLVTALRQTGRPDESAALAARLRELMEQERIDEVERNRLRLMRVDTPEAPVARRTP